QLLASPHDASIEPAPADAAHPDDLPIRNEPLRDFADAAQREAFARAIETARVPAMANDATVEDVDRAIERAQAALASWREVSVRERARMLRGAADRMRVRRDEIAGIIIRENGKNWRNADADVCEAIDFCNYYAAEAPRLFEPRRLGRFAGELNIEFHEPRGLAAVISPWNFPLAIACGMTT
ncbi:MAG TPA: aldehyde dehydrogenase family protein, partial [Tepidisphaeraceae bacterium]|nr:aldehyde dehydrogenase family protein [Tepidisphaeraceae bacterium]